MSERKNQRPERGHLENQERAYIAASRRSDRSLEARIQSARQASIIHKERTGKALRITEEVVKNEEMYEEEEDEIPRRFRMLAPHMQTGDPHLNNKLDAYLSNKVVLSNMVTATQRDWERQEEVHRLFAEAFPSLRGQNYGNVQGMQPDQGSLPGPSTAHSSIASPADSSDSRELPSPPMATRSFPSPPLQANSGVSPRATFQSMDYGNPAPTPQRDQYFAGMMGSENFQGNLGGMTPHSMTSHSFSGVLPTTYSPNQMGFDSTPPDLTPSSRSITSLPQSTLYLGTMAAQSSVVEGSAFTPELPPEARMLLEDPMSYGGNAGWQEQQLPELNKAPNANDPQAQGQDGYYQGNADPTMGWEMVTHPASAEEPNWESFINESEFNDLF